MTPVPRHLTQPLLDWLRTQSPAPPALLITADGVRRVRLEPLCPRCQQGHAGACEKQEAPREAV